MIPAFIYIVATLAANLTATLFIPFPVFGQVAVGTFIFGLTFTQRDRMHARGRPFVYAVIGLAAVLNLVMLATLAGGAGAWLAERLYGAGQPWLAANFEALGATGMRVFLASFLAIILAEAADTEVYHRLRERRWMLRVAGSNAVSIPLDSVLFNLIAFAGAPGFSALFLTQIIFGEIVIKYATGIAYALIYRKTDKARKAGNIPPSPGI